MSTRSLTRFVLCLALLPLPALAQPIVPVTTPGELTAALAAVQEGEILELASGTYAAPSGGWVKANHSVSFTVRGAAGATVTLDGAATTTIFKIADAVGTPSVVFENLIFTDGFTDDNGEAGAVTLDASAATFIDCEFRDSESSAPSTGGGGVAAFLGSTAHFFDCTFDGNRAKNEGAGLKVGGGSAAYIHNSEFSQNRTDVPDHRPSAAGAAIHAANSLLYISNTRFDSNTSACLGGAIYGLGDFDEPVTEIKIANSTFVDNLVEPDPGVGCNFNPGGGAIHAEDNVDIDVYNSRFLTNTAETGGAISMYRSQLEIYDSVFRGNAAVGDSDSGNGSVISSSSLDVASDKINHPPSTIIIHDSLVQGRFEGVGGTAFRGGCLRILGDTNRTYGRNGVTQMGTPETNRAVLDVSNTVFYDCDAIRGQDVIGSGVGGAMQLAHVALTLDDSLVMDCDALPAAGGDDRADGGGVRLINESAATITGTTFANNTAARRSGALHVAGSEITVDDCQFFMNDADTDGAAISTVTSTNAIGDFDFSVSGEIRDSIFKNQGNVDLRESDSDNPECEINDVVYNNNQFYTTPVDDDIYRSNIEGFKTVAELNSLTVVRTNCSNTVKSTVDNIALTSEPDLGALLGVPPQLLPVNAAGDPAPPTESFLGYAWCGSSATLDGGGLATNTGLVDGDSDTHTLVVGTDSFVTDLTDGPTPSAGFSANPPVIDPGGSSDLTWSTTAGTFLCLSIDRGVEVGSQVSSGMATVMPDAITTYSLHLLTEEGGVERQATVSDEEDPTHIFSDGFESGNTSAWTSVVGGS